MLVNSSRGLLSVVPLLDESFLILDPWHSSVSASYPHTRLGPDVLISGFCVELSAVKTFKYPEAFCPITWTLSTFFFFFLVLNPLIADIFLFLIVWHTENTGNKCANVLFYKTSWGRCNVTCISLTSSNFSTKKESSCWLLPRRTHKLIIQKSLSLSTIAYDVPLWNFFE